jgi:hypothetical protein
MIILTITLHQSIQVEFKELEFLSESKFLGESFDNQDESGDTSLTIDQIVTKKG